MPLGTVDVLSVSVSVSVNTTLVIFVYSQNLLRKYVILLHCFIIIPLSRFGLYSFRVFFFY